MNKERELEIKNKILKKEPLTELDVRWIMKVINEEGRQYIDDCDFPIKITKEYTDKVFEYLWSKYKTKRGTIKKNCLFGNREKYALENFSHIVLMDFIDTATVSDHKWFVPLYDIYSQDDEYGFEYYVFNDEIRLTG